MESEAAFGSHFIIQILKHKGKMKDFFYGPLITNISPIIMHSSSLLPFKSSVGFSAHVDAYCTVEHLKMSCKQHCTPSRILRTFWSMSGVDHSRGSFLKLAASTTSSLHCYSWHTGMNTSGKAGHSLLLPLQTLKNNLQGTTRRK